MEVVILPEPDEVGSLGARIIADAVRAKPDAVIGLATGSSPVGVYDELGAMVTAGELSLAHCTFFLLDEYVGLPPEHPESYRNVIERDFASKVDLNPARLHSLDGLAQDIPAACDAFEAAIRAAGGVDVQLLGLGTDGHIAFNEPGSSLTSRTRIKTLTQRTRYDNARFFDDDMEAVPSQCLTQGVATIMEARHLVVIGLGPGKADAVHQMVEGPITARWPASALQWHPKVTLLVDDGAASRLQLADYYRQTYAEKPVWQGF